MLLLILLHNDHRWHDDRSRSKLFTILSVAVLHLTMLNILELLFQSSHLSGLCRQLVHQVLAMINDPTLGST